MVLLVAVFAAAAIAGTLLLATGNGDPNMGPIGRPQINATSKTFAPPAGIQPAT